MMLLSSSDTFWILKYFDRLKKEGELPTHEEHDNFVETLPLDWQLKDNQFLLGVGKEIKRDQVQLDLNSKGSFFGDILSLYYQILWPEKQEDFGGSRRIFRIH